ARVQRGGGLRPVGRPPPPTTARPAPAGPLRGVLGGRAAFAMRSGEDPGGGESHHDVPPVRVIRGVALVVVGVALGVILFHSVGRAPAGSVASVATTAGAPSTATTPPAPTTTAAARPPDTGRPGPRRSDHNHHRAHLDDGPHQLDRPLSADPSDPAIPGVGARLRCDAPSGAARPS